MIMRILSRNVHILFLITLCTTYVFATDRLVPSAYSTIQNALSAAVNGDTIIISPGTYSGSGNSNLSVYNSVTIRSTNPSDPNVVASTIIDGFDSSAGNSPAFSVSPRTIVAIEGITIINCYDSAGGAIEASESTLTLRNCAFEDCIAWTDGGTIKARNSKIIMSGCDIIGGIAQGRGGAIYAEYKSNIELVNCNFTDNWSMSYGGGAVYISDSNLSATNCQFAENTAIGSRSDMYGGAIYVGNTYLRNVNIAITDSYFTDNFTTGYGGCIYVKNQPLVIDRCSFIKNTSQLTGSAIWCDTLLNLTNSVFAGNLANGGVMYFGNISREVKAVIRNCTFANNNVSKYALDLFGANYEISNSIFWGLSGKAPYTRHYTINTISFLYNDVEGNKFPDADIRIGNVSIDPDFVIPGGWNNGTYTPGDYHISLESPMINAGDPNTIIESGETDIDGNLRIRLGRIDIGAYEQGTHKMDFNEDGIVNFVDFAEFAEAWLWHRLGQI
jgi:hypothetical protein